MNAIRARGLAFFLVLGLARVMAGEADLTIADLAAYRAALTERPESGEQPVPATFRDLWSHPEAFQGRRVRVEGRVVRSFRQAAFGTFPPLVEAWAVTPAGDPFCLVFPETQVQIPPTLAAVVRFEGTFLKRIRYRGADMPRLAPLIVGPRPPVELSRPAAPPLRTHSSRLDLAIGLAAVAVVLLALARQYGKRPIRRSEDHDPPPTFFSDQVAGEGAQS